MTNGLDDFLRRLDNPVTPEVADCFAEFADPLDELGFAVDEDAKDGCGRKKEGGGWEPIPNQHTWSAILRSQSLLFLCVFRDMLLQDVQEAF